MINIFFFLMILAEFLAAVSQILLKKSAMKKYPSFIREYLNGLVISGYVLLMLSMIIAIFCYNDLGYMGVVVMEPIAFVMVMLLSVIVFKEKLNVRKLGGMLLILGGIVVFYAFG
jgi:multidrug transporter EmrE-like cation transporter